MRTLRLARELLDGHDLVKLEVLGDPQTLYPNMAETLAAAETLVKEGFKVMVYCSDDPILAQMLEEIGCVAVMPLASLIGSGMGILNPWNLQIIIENAKVPVLVDAGVGTASDAAIAMELGCDGVLMNTAIAAARDPVLMAARDEEGGRSRPRGVPRRPHAEEAVLGGAQLAHRREDRAARPLELAADPQLRPAAGQDHPGAAARACDELLPKYGLPFTGRAARLQRIFGRSAPLVLEIGSGMGETTAAIAAGASRSRFHRRRSARPGRRQPAEPHRRPQLLTTCG